MMFRHLVPFLWVLALSPYASLTHATLDAVFANSSFSQPNQVCLGDGTGRFACNDISADTNASFGVALGDINGDAFLDAVFANTLSSSQRNRVCLGSETGHFTCSDVSANAGFSNGVALGDINGDTFLDIVFANDSVPNWICLGDGTGRFACSDVSADTDGSAGVALGNINGDTFLDVVFANIGNPNQVCLGDGTGRFACSDVSADADSSEDVALGDVNSDTFLDAIFANSSLSSLSEPNQVCLGDGTGRFACSDVSADTNFSRGVALGDVNGDAFLDAVFANSSFSPPSEPNQVCLGDGTGRFACSDVSADTNFSWGVALGDINGDAFLDAVFANLNRPDIRGQNRVCLGDGTGHFTCSDVSTDADTIPSRDIALGKVDKAAVINSAPIPTLSLWAWFLLFILLAGMAMIALRTIL